MTTSAPIRYNKYLRNGDGKISQLIPVPVRKNQKLIGYEYQPVRLSELLRLIPTYDVFREAEDYYFDLDEMHKFVEFVINECVFPEGEYTGLPFVPELWQWCIYFNIFCWKHKTTHYRRFKECFILIPRKNGKALALNTEIPTPEGFVKIGDIKTGQIVFDKDGKQCCVTHAHKIIQSPKSYDVEFTNGEKVKACADHQWSVVSRLQHPKYNHRNAKLSRRNGQTSVVNSIGRSIYYDVWSTEEMYNKGVDCSYGKTFYVPMHNGIECENVDLLVDPYLLGYWLGDGTSNSGQYNVGCEDIKAFEKQVTKAGLKCIKRLDYSKYGQCYTVTIKHPTELWKTRLLTRTLYNLGKHIPDIYARSSKDQRLALLQGLMDSDGTVCSAGKILEFVNKSKRIARGMCDLLASLGIKFSCTAVQKSAQTGNPGTYYRIQFCAFKDTHPCFRLKRKLDRQRNTPNKTNRSRNVHIKSITPCDPEPMRCITVDSPSSTYLFGRTMLPTHNTVSFGSIPSLYMFYVDKEQRSQNFCCAADIEQASVNFRHTAYMIEQNPNLLNRLRQGKVNRSTRSFEHAKDGSMFKVLSAIAETKHGLSPNFVYIDEVHAHKSNELIDVMLTGTAARRQSLIIYTTTADYDRPSPCNELYDRAKRIATGEMSDPTFLPVIYEATVDDNFDDERVWKRANPNYGVSIYEEYFSRNIRQCKSNPLLLNRFLRLHLNIRTKTDTVWIPSWVWSNGNADEQHLLSIDEIKNSLYNHRLWHNYACDNEWFHNRQVDLYVEEHQAYFTWYFRKLVELQEEECYGGYDNSSVNDIASFSLFFPNVNVVLPWFWVPAESIYKRSTEERIPYDRWFRSGLINNTPLASISERDIAKALVGDGTQRGICNYFTNLHLVCFDAWGSNFIYETLYNAGLQAKKYPQSYVGMNGPCRKLQADIENKEFFHGSNPVLRWMMGNVTMTTNSNDQMRPNKTKSTDKIDGVVATLMAIGGHMYHGQQLITNIPGLRNEPVQDFQ